MSMVAEAWHTFWNTIARTVTKAPLNYSPPTPAPKPLDKSVDTCPRCDVRAYDYLCWNCDQPYPYVVEHYFQVLVPV